VQFNFNDTTLKFLKIIVKSAIQQKMRIFFVGGIVRDNILNLPVKDIDLILEGNAIDFSKNLPNEIKIKSIHKDFATIKVEYNNLNIDIASTRSEHYPYSACLPVVDKVGINLENDVKRRDFTVNSLYCELSIENNELKYNLIDLINGVKDIENKTLKVLHTKSYVDDPTRILRGIDFKYRFNFDFSQFDKNLIQDFIQNINLENGSYDRILSVYKKILSSQNSDLIFRDIINNQYYRILNNNNLTIDFNLIKKTTDLINLNNNEKMQFYINLILNHEIKKQTLNNEIEILNHFSKFSKENLAYYYYKIQDINIKKFIDFSNIKLIINGNDLITLGYNSGKTIGIVLNELLKAKIKNKDLFLTKEQEIHWVKRYFPKEN